MRNLNPLINRKLNPRIAVPRNPFLRPELNPLIRAAINPLVTSSINYRVNSNRNPRVKSRLNPQLTASLNPNFVGEIAGLYLFNLQCKSTGFTVTQSDGFWLLFDNAVNFEGVAIRASREHFNIHGLDNKWIGFFSRAVGNIWLQFTLAEEWCGFTS